MVAADDDADAAEIRMGPGSDFTRSVSGANVVAGEDAIDDGIRGTNRHSTLLHRRRKLWCAWGALENCLGLDEGAGLSIGRLFVGVPSDTDLAAVGAVPDEPEPAQPPVICVSSSS